MTSDNLDNKGGLDKPSDTASVRAEIRLKAKEKLL